MTWLLGRMPRSLTRTTIDLCVLRLMTRTIVPKGRVLWAAVIASASKISPLAVCWPSNTPPYQVARPRSAAVGMDGFAGFAGAAAARTLSAGGPGGNVEAGRASWVSACTVSVESVRYTANMASDKAPATGQNHLGLAELRLRKFLRSTIRLFY